MISAIYVDSYPEFLFPVGIRKGAFVTERRVNIPPGCIDMLSDIRYLFKDEDMFHCEGHDIGLWNNPGRGKRIRVYPIFSICKYGSDYRLHPEARTGTRLVKMVLE